jgi:HEAT repeat protein
MLDAQWPEHIRRKAMLARLYALRADPPTRQNVKWRSELTKQLAHLQLYNVLSPLEAMFRTQEKTVKLAVLAAMGTLFFKRSFVVLREALASSDGELVEAASVAIEALHFQHAFDPLTRIAREERAPRARAAAIRALARIDTTEAAEYLLQLMTHGDDQESAWAVDALSRSRGAKFLDLVRSEGTALSPRARAAVQEVARVRGYTL